MTPAELDNFYDQKEVQESGGLLGGLNAWCLKMLCENPWNGGGGYSPREVSQWSLDQCWFRLCDEKLLGSGSGRTKSMHPCEVPVAEDGTVKGVAADGTPIRAKIGGKSLARRLAEEAERRRIESEVKKKGRRERRRRRGN